MANTAAGGAESQQNQQQLMDSAAQASLYSTHPAYVYSDPQYALYYQQFQVSNPNFDQQQYDANGSLVHPPGVDPNAAVSASAYANASAYLDPQQLAYYYAAYPQAVASGPAATAAYYQDPNAAHLAYNQYNNGGAVMQPNVPQRSANPNSAFRGKRPAIGGGVRRTNNNNNINTNNPMKKRQKIPKVVQSAWCDLCKVECNSKDELDKHKTGKKHKKNMEKLIAASAPPPPPPPPPPPVTAASLPTTTTNASSAIIIGPQENPSKGKSNVGKKGKGKRKAADTENLETKKKKMVEGGTSAEAVRLCDVCNVVCNSEHVFRYHLAGQKHAAMVNKQAARMKWHANKAKNAAAKKASASKNAETGGAATIAEAGSAATIAEVAGSAATIAEAGGVTTISEAGGAGTSAETGETANAEAGATTNAEAGVATGSEATGHHIMAATIC